MEKNSILVEYVDLPGGINLTENVRGIRGAHDLIKRDPGAGRA